MRSARVRLSSKYWGLVLKKRAGAGAEMEATRVMAEYASVTEHPINDYPK
jgi:hypothetical protein